MSLILSFVEELSARLEKMREAVEEQNAEGLPEAIILGTVADY